MNNIDFNDAILFCLKWCGSLTYKQEVLIKVACEKNNFFGVARPIGRMVYFPAILLKNSVNAIDREGYYQLGSVEGRRDFNQGE